MKRSWRYSSGDDEQPSPTQIVDSPSKSTDTGDNSPIRVFGTPTLYLTSSDDEEEDEEEEDEEEDQDDDSTTSDPPGLMCWSQK